MTENPLTSGPDNVSAPSATTQVAEQVPATTTTAALQEKLRQHQNAMREKMVEQLKAGRPIDRNLRLVHDPFSGKNPHNILCNPSGRVLAWKNPKYRDERGWRGWTPVTYDDEIGRNLSVYLSDPPHKMEGSAQLDNKVRRGDAVLCWLPEDVWLARQLEATRRQLEYEARASLKETVEVSRGVLITGPGVERQDSYRSNPPIKLDGDRLGGQLLLGE